ncbi:hypothetical protein [Stygiolobus azoricus]|nr:hypothetical protein [Stygiolobus azoricus]
MKETYIGSLIDVVGISEIEIGV